MILKCSFQVLSFALYGETVSQPSPPPTLYEPIPIPTVDPLPLPDAIDPANAPDPTSLATHLLKMIPDAPPLSLVIRLMFCLKPTDDDWEDPAFPYHGTSLEIPEDFDLELAGDLISRPVRKETSEDAISTFAKSVGDLIGPKVNISIVRISKPHPHLHSRVSRSRLISQRYSVLQRRKCLPWHWLCV